MSLEVREINQEGRKKLLEVMDMFLAQIIS